MKPVRQRVAAALLVALSVACAEADEPASPTLEQIELGRHLFYELRLSKHQDRACGTCHEQAKAFTDGFHRAVGTDGDVHGHNTPTLVNVSSRSGLGWASPGGQTLEEQLLVPLLGTDPIEMGMGGHEAELLATLTADPLYAGLFADAFPDQPSPVTIDNLARAIAAFERTIVSRDAPLDRYLDGDEDAIGADAKRGWVLFNAPEVGCIRCHSDADFASAGYYNIGLYDVDGEGGYPSTAQGLIEATGQPSDMGRFRTPSLRNLSYTWPYMHDGSMISLADIVDVKAQAGRVVQSGPFVGDGRSNPHKSAEVQPIALTASERADLVALLLALDDETLVSDPRLASPFQ